MTRNGVAASVAENKERNPGKYCPAKRCLWRTGGGYCPRHQHLAQGDRQDAAAGKDYSEEFTPSEAEAIHRAMVREEQGRQSEERAE